MELRHHITGNDFQYSFDIDPSMLLAKDEPWGKGWEATLTCSWRAVVLEKRETTQVTIHELKSCAALVDGEEITLWEPIQTALEQHILGEFGYRFD